MQVALFQRIRWEAKRHPDLELVYAVPNAGERHIFVAQRMKAAGLKAGVLDIHWPVASRGFYGLWMELKVGKNKPTDQQLMWIERLKKAGHCVRVVYDDWQLAWDLMVWYGELN